LIKDKIKQGNNNNNNIYLVKIDGNDEDLILKVSEIHDKINEKMNV
jgi:hypothetical protein